MKAIITGANGTLGAVLRQMLEARGDTVVAWDRARVPIDRFQAMEDFVRAQRPDVLFHLATASQLTGRDNETWLVNYEWTSELAWIARTLDLRFVFTSSIMVFTNDARGPFTVESVPDAPTGYGYEKRMAEERALAQNPQSIVARIGWQIGDTPVGNQMIEFFARQMAQHGQIRASRRWYPACSFLTDTAQTLIDLLEQPGSLYQVDSNTRWTFYEIALALNALHGGNWNVTPTDDFVYDQRMVDPRVPIPPLSARLPALDS